MTLEDFENYYANVSASQEDDAAFEELVTSVWTQPASRVQQAQPAAALSPEHARRAQGARDRAVPSEVRTRPLPPPPPPPP